jgi:hypothetical protein
MLCWWIKINYTVFALLVVYLRVLHPRNSRKLASAQNAGSFTAYFLLMDMHMEEHCTVYFSKSTRLSNETDFTTILQQSRRDNAIADISGILLYVRGSIVQVLEGQTEAVETLFKRIQIDSRHTDVERVMNRPINQRLFADWTMGYETVTSRQMEDIKGSKILDEHRDD